MAKSEVMRLPVKFREALVSYAEARDRQKAAKAATDAAKGVAETVQAAIRAAMGAVNVATCADLSLRFSACEDSPASITLVNGEKIPLSRVKSITLAGGKSIPAREIQKISGGKAGWERLEVEGGAR